MPGPQQRLRRRGRRTSRFDRVFDWLTDRRVVACVWLLAGLIAFVAGLGVEGVGVQPGMAQAAAVTCVLGVAGLAGMYWRRHRGDGTPERRLSESPKSPPKWQRWAGVLGVLAMGLGVVVMVGDWLSAHRHVPSAELILPLHETKESVEVVHGTRQMDVMLPLRTTLQGVSFGDDPSAEVQFARPGQEGVPAQEFGPGDSLDVEGKRFAFAGFSTATTRMKAVISSPDDETISTAVAEGDQFQISVDGPSYRVVDTRRDFMDVHMPAVGFDEETIQLLLLEQGYPRGAIGPAVQLEVDGGQTLWLFERAGATEIPVTGQTLQLEGLQEVPSVVMSVTSVRPFWPFALGLFLFVVGWALTFGVAERVARSLPDGGWGVWSVNRIEGPHFGAGSEGTPWYVLILVVPVVVGLGLGLIFEITEVGWLGLGGLVALMGLPMTMADSWRRRAIVLASTIPLVAVVAALVTGQPWVVEGPGRHSAALWTAMLGSWLAMAAALLGAGMLAERHLGRWTDGAVTAALAVWAAMAAVVTLGMQRGADIAEGMALPLTSDAGEAVWAMSDVAAASKLQLPMITSGAELGWMAVVAAVLATTGLVGRAFGSMRVALIGWIGALLTSVVGALNLLGVGASAGHDPSPGEEAYAEMAGAWLQARELPATLAEHGEFQFEGALRLDTSALAPELMAFALAALIAAAMIGMTLWRHYHRAGRGGDELSAADPYAGRDLFVRAMMFGAMGWVLGQMGAWEYLGAAGVQQSMEWLGLSVLFGAMAVLMLGWRRDGSAAERLAAVVGPAVVLCALLWLMLLGASAGYLPGTSVRWG